VSRQVKGEKRPDKIPGPRVQSDYVENFNAIDRNDQDSANYSTTICTIVITSKSFVGYWTELFMLCM
jgi:hypothetical protein